MEQDTQKFFSLQSTQADISIYTTENIASALR